jgi:hypothetical protein
MKVELERSTTNGNRSVTLIAGDTATHSATIRQWIRMLQVAERWLREKEPKE